MNLMTASLLQLERAIAELRALHDDIDVDTPVFCTLPGTADYLQLGITVVTSARLGHDQEGGQRVLPIGTMPLDKMRLLDPPGQVNKIISRDGKTRPLDAN